MSSSKVLSLFLGVSFGTVLVIVFLVTPFSITAVTATKSSDRDRQSQNLLVSKIGTLEPLVHLPILRADPTPTATSPPPSILLNGGFEQGPLVWDQYSSNGWPLIVHSNNLPLGSHSGEGVHGWGAITTRHRFYLRRFIFLPQSQCWVIGSGSLLTMYAILNMTLQVCS